MIHSLLPMHQMPTTKPPLSKITHLKKLKNPPLIASLFLLNTLCNLRDLNTVVGYII